MITKGPAPKAAMDPLESFRGGIVVDRAKEVGCGCGYGGEENFWRGFCFRYSVFALQVIKVIN